MRDGRRPELRRPPKPYEPASRGDWREHGNALLQESRLYELLRERTEVHQRTLEVTLLEPGAQAYAFTFG